MGAFPAQHVTCSVSKYFDWVELKKKKKKKKLKHKLYFQWQQFNFSKQYFDKEKQTYEHTYLSENSNGSLLST